MPAWRSARANTTRREAVCWRWSSCCVSATHGACCPARRGAILDLGTGSGILAMAAAKTLRRPVLATDIEPWSVRVAGENARLNGVAKAGAADPRRRLACGGGAEIRAL